MAEEFAPAKINLALHVTGQREDGFHLIETLVTFATTGDLISVTNDPQTEEPDSSVLKLAGPEASALGVAQDNLVLKAARLLLNDQDYMRLSLTLDKRLPVASGIGGGSADAAAALRLLNREYKPGLSPKELHQIGQKLGSDVPMCIVSKPLLARGTGDILDPVSLPSFPIVLINPRVPVSTPDIFRTLSDRNNSPLPKLPAAKDAGIWIEWLGETRNDLYPPAAKQVGAIDDCLTALRDKGAALARMSGSGATCFGLFENEEDAAGAASSIANLRPEWWVISARTFESTETINAN